MTRLPGEQLDDWLRRAAAVVAPPQQSGGHPQGGKVSGAALQPWPSFLKRGIMMADRLIRQVGPTLEQLAPLAWHRDVNSHNVLVSDGVENSFLDPADNGDRADFALCDLGLAVDSRSWVSVDGAWRVTDIGGDCRYWPASSWMVHLYGADYLTTREEFCRQYQTRLDVHGLGITAVEIVCSVALAARSAGAPRVVAGSAPDSDSCWEHLLDAWQVYHATVGQWWEMIYSVFSVGGDFRPVHAWLVQEDVANQVIALIADIRQALRNCASYSEESVARVLCLLADLIDENSELQLSEACEILAKEGASTDGLGGNAGVCTTKASQSPTARGANMATVVALSAATAEESRKTLERLAPIPRVSKLPQVDASELTPLRNAKGQLHRDLEQLQQLKQRLLHAQKAHEEARHVGASNGGRTTY